MSLSYPKPKNYNSFFLALFILLLADHALAHKVIVFAWVEGGSVHMESKFKGGRKVKNAPVDVYNAEGKRLLSGQTNQNGEFNFVAPVKDQLKIVVRAGTGHQGEWTLPSDAFGLPAQPARSKKSAQNVSSEVRPTTGGCMNAEEIKTIVAAVVAEKVAPLTAQYRMLLEHQDQTRAIDIFGGIGYIFGLVGLGAYFNFRKSKGDPTT